MSVSRRFLLTLAAALLALTTALGLAIPAEPGVTEHGLLVGLVMLLLAPATTVADAAGLSSGTRMGPIGRLSLVVVAYLGGVLLALVWLVNAGRLNP